MASTSEDDFVISTSSELNENNLPTNKQVIEHFFHHTRSSSPKLTIDEAKGEISKKLENIWQNAKLNTQSTFTIKKKIQNLYEDYRVYQRSRHKTTTDFFKNLNNVFDISNEDLRVILQGPEKTSLFSLPVNDIAERMKNLQLPGMIKDYKI